MLQYLTKRKKFQNMELVEIVDMNGNPTGKIVDKEEAHVKNLLHNGVIIFVINDKNQILLSKRSANKKYNPNKWEVCGGHVHAGEEIEEAAVREITEELGLNKNEVTLSSLLYKECFKNKTDSHIFYYYYIKCNKGATEFKIQENELSEVKWFEIDKIIELINKKDGSILFTQDRLKIINKLKEL